MRVGEQPRHEYGGLEVALHGVPKGLDLSDFVGFTLTQVCIGPGDVQFHFSGDNGATRFVQAECAIEVRGPEDGDPRRIKISNGTWREPVLDYRLLINQDVTDWLVSPPDWVELTFATGARLRLLDESTQYESLHIDGLHV